MSVIQTGIPMADSKNAVLICCYCDNPLSCGHCGMEQPADVRDAPVQMADSRMDEREDIAKRIFWEQHTIMHDHEQLWRECEKQFIYLDCADRIMAQPYFANRSTPVQSDGPVAWRKALQWIANHNTLWTQGCYEKPEIEVLERSPVGNIRVRGQYGKRALAALSTSPNGWKPGDPETDRPVAERALYVDPDLDRAGNRRYWADRAKNGTILPSKAVTQWDAGSVDVPRFMEVVRSRWNFEENEFDVIEKVLSDAACVAALTSPAPSGAREALNRIIFFPFISERDWPAIRNIAKDALYQLPATDKGREDKP